MTIIQVLTKDQLIAANAWAIEVGYNRAFEPAPLLERLDSMPDDIRFPITLDLPHHHANGVEVDEHRRCHIVLDPSGTRGYLDIDLDLFNSLDTVEVKE